MSSQHGHEGDEQHGAEPTEPTGPTEQFDAFRARRADERAQQETQSEYVFPEEYAADPGAGFPPQQPPMPPIPPMYGGYGADPAGAAGTPKRKWRSVAVLGGAVLVAAALATGVWAALGSGGASPGNAAAGGSATSTATGASTGTAGKRTTTVLNFRVTIRSIGADSFTGTALANNETVTVELTSKTRFGTKAHPFAAADLSSGETVIVRGRRTGTDTVTATVIAANTTSSSSSDPGVAVAAAFIAAA